MATDYLEYTTQQGDTFDILALDAYNDEYNASFIIDANPEYARILIFDAGIKLKMPILQQQANTTLPPWKR